MFDFFRELPGQEARTISELEPPECSINLVGTQMMKNELELGYYCVPSSQTRIERLLLDSLQLGKSLAI